MCIPVHLHYLFFGLEVLKSLKIKVLQFKWRQLFLPSFGANEDSITIQALNTILLLIVYCASLVQATTNCRTLSHYCNYICMEGIQTLWKAPVYSFYNKYLSSTYVLMATSTPQLHYIFTYCLLYCFAQTKTIIHFKQLAKCCHSVMKKPETQWKLISPHYSFYWRFFVNLRKKNLLLPLLTAVKWAKSIKTVQLEIV